MPIRRECIPQIKAHFETFCKMLPEMNVTLRALEIQAGKVVYGLSKAAHNAAADVAFSYGDKEEFLVFYARRPNIDPIEMLRTGVIGLDFDAANEIDRQQIAQNLWERLEIYFSQDPDLKSIYIEQLKAAAPKDMILASNAPGQKGFDGASAKLSIAKQRLGQARSASQLATCLEEADKAIRGVMREAIQGTIRATQQVLAMPSGDILVQAALGIPHQSSNKLTFARRNKRRTTDEITIEEGQAFLRRSYAPTRM